MRLKKLLHAHGCVCVWRGGGARETVSCNNVALHAHEKITPWPKALTSENYEHAWKLLTESYGNPHLVISPHMDKLLKLERFKSSNNVREFGLLYDKLESHLRSLLVLGIDSKHYGPLLIPLVLEKLPADIRLEISRSLGKESWNIAEFMVIVKMK